MRHHQPAGHSGSRDVSRRSLDSGAIDKAPRAQGPVCTAGSTTKAAVVTARLAHPLVEKKMKKSKTKFSPEVSSREMDQMDCEPVGPLMASPWQGCPPQHKGQRSRIPSAPLTSAGDLEPSTMSGARIRLPHLVSCHVPSHSPNVVIVSILRSSQTSWWHRLPLKHTVPWHHTVAIPMRACLRPPTNAKLWTDRTPCESRPTERQEEHREATHHCF